MSKRLIIGPYTTPSLSQVVEFTVATGEVFKKLGGKFVRLNASEELEVASATDVNLIGWALVDADYTSAAGDKLSVCIDPNAIYGLPASTTLTAASLKAVLGKTCDLAISSSIQQCDITAHAIDCLQVVGGNVDRNIVFVRMNAHLLYELDISENASA